MRNILTIILTLGAFAVHAEQPLRIVSLGGAVTETLWALGAGSEVVAVDDSSTRPGEASSRERVGYYRMVSAEGVLSIEPDLVIASDQAGPPEAMRHIENAGVRVVRVPGAATVAGCLGRIRAVGEAVGREDEAASLVAAVERDLSTMPEPTVNPPSVLFVFARGAGTLNVAGTDTAADEIIRLAGGVNAVTEYEGYRPMTAESVVAAAPDLILLTDSGMGSIGGPAGLLQIPGIKATPAGKNGRVASLDDLYLLGFGPHLPDAVNELHALLYP